MLQMMHRRPIPILAVLGALLALLPAHAAFAQEVWRLAGTFNGWNTSDPEWTMKPDGAPDQFFIERELAPGDYRFKFVQGGDWAKGHFGAGATPGSVEQPGSDIPLNIAAKAKYRITLSTGSKRWLMRVAAIEQPVVVARVYGTARVNRPMLVDLSESVTMADPTAIPFTVTSLDQPIRLTNMNDGTARILVTPTKAGPLTLQARIQDQVGTATETISMDVGHSYFARHFSALERDPVPLMMDPQSNGDTVGILQVPVRVVYTAIEVRRDDTRIVNATNVDLGAGKYAIIVRDGEVVRRAGDESAGNFLHPGNWREFTLMPPVTTRRVFLVGDFNNWAGPGQPGAIEMLSRPDGSFAAITDLPEGTHRYQFEMDGGVRIADPNGADNRTLDDQRQVSVIVVGPRPKDLGEARPNNINPAGVRHNPASAFDFRPVHGGLGVADLSVTALPGDAASAFVTVRTDKPGAQSAVRVPMTRSEDLGGWDRFTARVMTGGPSASYTFTLEDGSASFTTAPFTANIEPQPPVPEWAMGAVWYQIFPERFRNGNPLNDPHGESVFNKPWTDDWYTITPEEEKRWREVYKVPAGQPFPPRQGGDLFHVVWDRRYGGDLQGIAEKFEYLRELGVTALYMNPVFEAESMHKYDATDFRHIDDNLSWPESAGRVPEKWSFRDEPNDPSSWTWTPGDRYFVEEFLPKAKQNGIRVVLDGVFNHTGLPFWAFADIQRNGDKSEFKDWFFVKFDANGRLESWESWFNTGALPKFRQTADGDLVAPVKEHIFAITRRWMDPNGDGDPSDGIDGWRLDVALDIGPPFWKDWRALVKSINPDAVIIAEIWDDATPYLKGQAFDTQMHYPFAKAVTDWLGVRPGMTSDELGARLAAAFNDDAPQTRLIHQNLFGSHDTDRYVSMLQNPNRAYDDGNRPQDHAYPYNDTKPSAETYKRSLLGVAMQATYTGAPMVYYGDEVGMWGADDPTDRKPFPWPDVGQMQNPDERGDFRLLEQYTRWLNLRNDPVAGPVLKYGATRHLDTRNPDVFAFERSLNGTRVVVAINRGRATWSALPLLPKGAKDAAVGPVSASYWVFREASPVGEAH